MLIDAGGGTVDIIVYKVSVSDPLRLVREEVEPNGKLKPFAALCNTDGGQVAYLEAA